MTDPVWRSVDVDGQTYFWTAYPSRQRFEDGPWEEIECLVVSRRAAGTGVSQGFAPGTVITEHDAVTLLRMFRADGGELT